MKQVFWAAHAVSGAQPCVHVVPFAYKPPFVMVCCDGLLGKWLSRALLHPLTTLGKPAIWSRS